MLTPMLIEDSFERFYGYHIAAVIFCLLCCLMLGYYFHKWHFYYVPESAGHMLVGLVAGLFATLTGLIQENALIFSPEIFFFILLPIIILEAGYSMKTGPFFRNIGIISLLAVGGTLVAATLTGLGIYAASSKFDAWRVVGGTNKNFLECLLFGTLLSAVDPIATLAILGSKDVAAPPTLYAIVFGESVLNDAVTIVLFDTLYPFANGDDDFGGLAILEAIGLFFGISIGSILLGLFFGLLCSYILKISNMQNLPESEFLVIFLFCFGAYGIAEYLELSGIMAIFVAGITLGRYAFKNASMTTKWSTTFGFKAMALAAETFVFIYLGVQLALAIQMKPKGDVEWSIPFTLFVLFWCFLARAVHVPLFVNLANLKRKNKIHAEMQFVMWFGGLRGAIAFALALNFPETNRPIVITVTLCVVIVTTFVCGGLTEPILSKLDIKDDEPLLEAEKDQKTPENEDEGKDTFDIDTLRESPAAELSGLALWCYKFDSEVIHKMFTKHKKSPKEMFDWDGDEKHVRQEPQRGLSMVRKTTQEFNDFFIKQSLAQAAWANKPFADERSRFVSEGHYYTWR